MMINRRRAYVNKKGLLPSGYVQLEYIEQSHSSVYIDTGFVPTINTDYVIKYCLTESVNASNVAVLGSREASTTAGGHLFDIFFNYLPSYSISFTRGNVYHDERNNDYRLIVGTPVVLSMENGTCKYNGIILANLKPTVFDCSKNIYLFHSNANAGYNPKYKGRIYFCIIKDNGEVVRNFIPCINPNNIVGMYDTVNGVFYSSPNGTAFIAGPEV